MRRQSQEEVAAAARARLALLGRELAQAGLSPSHTVPTRVRPADPPAWDDALDPRDQGDPSRRDDVSPPGSAASADTVVRPAVVVPDPGRHARRRMASLLERSSGWLGDRLPATLRGRVALGPGHVALVTLLAALGLVVAAVVALRSGSDGTPVRVAARSSPLVPATSASPLAVSASGSATAGPPAAPGAAASGATTVVVDVAGKVRHPGIATLPAGSRVADALRRAGGARPGVDLSALNLARVLVDGEQILVGEGPPPGAAASAAAAPDAPSAPGALVNLNTATLQELDTLPGVGPVTAQKILDWRTAHQAFSSVDELLEVDGIGDKTLADLAPYVTL